MKALVIAVYIGPLPPLMPLWLRSAGCNPGTDFLVISDRDAPARLPGNVRFRRMDLAALRAEFAGVAGISVALGAPYKLNDFKPLFWCLADDLEGYDYWGYCDLDVIFGRLDALCAPRLGHYDMLLSEGHLRFLRNDEPTRQAWRQIEVPRPWQAILSEPENFGMDEHHGINRVFAGTDRSWFSDPTMVADIDPSFRQFRRLPELRNWRDQAFYWRDGCIFHEYVADGRRYEQEVLYIHLQKRKLAIDPACDTAPAFNIDPGGLVPRQAGDAAPAAIARRNPWHAANLPEARILLRDGCRRLLRRPGHFEAVDRPDRKAAP